MREVVLGPGWLPWDRTSGEERLFVKALLITMALSLLLGALVPLINVPEKRREEAEAIPLRLARMMNERHPPPAPPKVEKRSEEAPPPQTIEQVPMSAARQKAASTGLLAMSNELAALSTAGVLDKVTARSDLTVGGSQWVQGEASMVSNASQGSGGIDTSTLVREKQAESKPAEHATTQVALAKEDAARLDRQQAPSSEGKVEPVKKSPKRDQDTISETLDRNKGAVYAIYNRALRQNALLAGNVVFSITIEPSGKVSDCHVVSSELHDEELERKLASRIAMINFAAQAVPQIVVKWPINFLPN